MNRYHAHPMDEPEPDPVVIPEMTLAEWAVALASGIVALIACFIGIGLTLAWLGVPR